MTSAEKQLKAKLIKEHIINVKCVNNAIESIDRSFCYCG